MRTVLRIDVAGRVRGYGLVEGFGVLRLHLSRGAREVSLRMTGFSGGGEENRQGQLQRQKQRQLQRQLQRQKPNAGVLRCAQNDKLFAPRDESFAPRGEGFVRRDEGFAQNDRNFCEVGR